jgi:hypothetical protein
LPPQHQIQQQQQQQQVQPPSQGEQEARSLFDGLNGLSERLGEFEFELAKQNPFSDRLETLRAQENEFSALARTHSQFMPLFSQTLEKCKLFLSNEENKTVKLCEDLARFENQCSNKLNMVKNFFLCYLTITVKIELLNKNIREFFLN